MNAELAINLCFAKQRLADRAEANSVPAGERGRGGRGPRGPIDQPQPDGTVHRHITRMEDLFLAFSTPGRGA